MSKNLDVIWKVSQLDTLLLRQNIKTETFYPNNLEFFNIDIQVCFGRDIQFSLRRHCKPVYMKHEIKYHNVVFFKRLYTYKIHFLHSVGW